MITPQIQPSYIQDYYHVPTPAWPGGAFAEVVCVVYGEFHSRGGFVWDNASEDFWFPHLIEKGEGQIQVDGGPKVTLGPGDVYVMAPRRQYRRHESHANPWAYRWLGLRGPRTGDLLTGVGLPHSRVLARPGLLAHLEPTFAQLRAMLARPKLTVVEAAELAFAFAGAVARQDASQSQMQVDAANQATAAMAWFRTHYTQGCTVADAARALGISRVTLFRLFRTYAKASPKMYLDHLRREHAKHLLADGRLLQKEVAIACGYADHRHMAQAFRRATGRSPGGWRKPAGSRD